jgi:N-acetylmuramic acid 6-phosphate etherase
MRKTEMRNPATMHIDRMSGAELAQVMQDENYNAVRALDAALPAIAAAIDAVAERMKRGGRLFYVGCGTSGRLGVLDASECPPTYGVSKETVIGVIAGGDTALRNAVEGVEDDAAAGERDLSEWKLTEKDSVMGISAAGGAQYVLGALAYAKAHGALTVGLSSTEGSELLRRADIAILTDTGAEVVTGSTRMKAGTAHKLVLNMLSTGVMVKCGYVFENMMITLKPSNKKLAIRMCGIVHEMTGIPAEDARAYLERAGWDIRAAVELIRNT